MSEKKDRPILPPKPEKKSGKKKTLLGDKARAGRLLSGYLRGIAQEETEFLELPDGDRVGTKAEALARLMFKMALGFIEKDVKTGVETKHGPDRGMIGLIWDRIEGRATLSSDNLAKKRTLPKRVSDANKQRLNDMVKNDNAD